MCIRTVTYPYIVVHHPSDLTTVANPTNVVYYCTSSCVCMYMHMPTAMHMPIICSLVQLVYRVTALTHVVMCARECITYRLY